VIGGIAKSVSASMEQMLASQCGVAVGFSEADFVYKLNRDFDFEGLSAGDLTALVSAWQSGGISRDTLLHNLRVRELLPPGRTEEEERRLIEGERATKDTKNTKAA
jgi:hypothetical protein